MSAPAAVLTPRRGDRRRTSGSMLLSVVLHAAVIAWLLMQQPQVGGGLPLTEIDYMTSAEVASPVAAVMAPAPVRPAPQPAETQERFRRAAPEADVAPEPQSDFALADRIAARLDRLRSSESNAVVAAATPPVSSRWSAAGAPSTGPAPSAPMALERGAPARAPLSLDRGAPVKAARLDAATIAKVTKHSEPEAPARASGATRQLAGARLAGPVADRPILHSVTPVYPEWAKGEAVEGTVTLRFYVRADGSIKENILVEKTAGFDDFDQSAVAALREWRFQPLHAGRTGEQWGTITFQFRLRDAG